jgi:hypothetical protein
MVTLDRIIDVCTEEHPFDSPEVPWAATAHATKHEIEIVFQMCIAQEYVHTGGSGCGCHEVYGWKEVTMQWYA